jgi:hypothetical protein
MEGEGDDHECKSGGDLIMFSDIYDVFLMVFLTVCFAGILYGLLRKID